MSLLRGEMHVVVVVFAFSSLVLLGLLSKLQLADAFGINILPHAASSLTRSNLHLHPITRNRRHRLRQPLSSSSSSSLVRMTTTSTETSGNNNGDINGLAVEPPPFWTGSNATSSSSSSATTTTAAEEEDLDSSSQFDWNKQWYPVLPLTSLDNFEKPTMAITILNRPLVVWRNSQQKYVIFDDACPHRRAPLSTGRVVCSSSSNDINNDDDNNDDGCRLACRYHGWEFNASGVCTKIPMLATENQDGSKTNKFRVTTYPTQQAGGLLWVFMDPTIKSPPPLPTKALLEKGADSSSSKSSLFSCNMEPVSYLSMIENSFDPAHAPFTHAGTMAYSPANAIPMQEYNLVEPMSLDGFQVQHSDYQKSSFFGTMSNVTTYTKRTFIPPCTTVFQGPFLSGILYFCPNKPAETNVIAHFSFTKTASTGTGKQQPNQSLKQRLVALTNNKTPASYKSLVADCIHFWRWTSDSQLRFASQDRVTMQGQDLRKLLFFRQQYSGGVGDGQRHQQPKWDDLVPTTSDVGVSVFQKWMRRYGRGGPFSISDMTQSAAAATTAGGNTGDRMTSMWERHGKNCEICQRMMKRLAFVESNAKKWSIRSFGASAIAALYAVIAASSSFWRILLARGTISTSLPSSQVIAALSWSILALVVSMGFQRVAFASSQLQQRVLNTPNIPSIKLMEVYQDV